MGEPIEVRLAKVVELHHPQPIYGECWHAPDYGCTPVEAPWGADPCNQSIEGWYCRECCTANDVYLQADCPHGWDHSALTAGSACATMDALTGSEAGDTVTAKMLPTPWAGNAIRVEHLIAPGPNVPPGIHVGDCQCRCGEMQTCPKCRRVASVAAVKGRWDAEAGCTALPFDAVWVRLSCGCEAGDSALAEPPVECAHDVVEFDPGNRVPPYGWEQYPGWYCATCGEQIDEDERR